MSADLKQYSDIIEELKSHLNSVDFDVHFKHVTADVPKAKQFLIKMELKRIAQPCNHQIDLRGHVQGTPEPYDYKGVIHYLDAVGRSIFEDQIDKFGLYTVGVYEAVKEADNNHRVLHQKEQQSRLAEKSAQSEPRKAKTASVKGKKKVFSVYGGALIPFASYGIRNEERMNFSINVELQFGIGDVVKASTSDLSVSGAKVKIPSSKQVIVGQKVGLYLTGLEQEFELGLKDGIQYEIVGIDKASEDHNYIRMKRTFDEDVNSFDEFLEKFINGNKRHYKVDLENTLEAVVIKGYEQFYMPRITALPVYLRKISDKLVPTMTLATENNRRLLGYFSDENKNLVLQSILNETRIQTILSKESVASTTLYCFTHAKAGKLYFYSATEDELAKDSKLKSAFFAFGSKKASWEVFNLHIAETHEKDSFIPLSIPSTASKEVEKLNTPPSPRVKGMLKDISYIATLTALEGQQLKSDYQNNNEFDASMTKELQAFGHPKLKRYINISVETIEYVNLRSEERYLYKSNVELGQSGSKDSFIGSTRDFSIHGLQVVLETSSTYKKGDVVLLNLVELQSVTKKLKLDKLPYEVMAISKDKTIINLRAFDVTKSHAGTEFFRKLISQNRSKLTPAKMESKFPGLAMCLRNLATKSIANLPIYFSKQDNKLVLSAVGHGVEDHLLLKLLTYYKPENSDVSLYPLICNDAISEIFLPILTEMKRTDRPQYVDLLLEFNSHGEDEEAGFSSIYVKEYNDTAIEFIDHAVNNHLFAAFRIYLSRTGRPDMSYIAKELHYIGNYAKHRAKDLEHRLWSIVGVGEVIDCTDEVLNRFNYNKTIRQFQNKKQLQLN